MRWALFLINFLFVFSVAAQELNQEQILANLKFRVPELENAEVILGDIEASPYADLKQGSFTINGQQTFQFLLSEDPPHLILLATDPIDVSLSEEEIKELLIEQERQEQLVAAELHGALNRLSDGKPSRGPIDAPITIHEFSDFQCPYCARASLVVEELVDKYPDDIRFVYLHFPLDIHDWAKPAAVAAECAARQSEPAFWLLHDNFFEFQGSISKESMFDDARSWLQDLDIDLDAWETCATDESSAANQGAILQVDIATTTATRFGLTGTPGFFVNGHYLSGSQPLEVFEDLIASIKAEL
ncbi:MAG: thioredoxin domain-containing protein [Bacteroidetes bacterium]|nr:thioredoxin domain-containing protein [Bacteroidota bacterium]